MIIGLKAIWRDGLCFLRIELKYDQKKLFLQKKNMRQILFILVSFLLFNACNQPANKVVGNKTINVAIEGMTCAEGCAKHIQETIAELPGVSQSKVNFDQKLAFFQFDSTKINTQEILLKISSLNEGKYKANLIGSELPATEKNATSEEAVEEVKKEEAHS